MDKQVDYARIERAANRRRRVGKGIVYALLTVWGLIVLFPFYWMLLTSIKSYGSYNAEYVPSTLAA